MIKSSLIKFGALFLPVAVYYISTKLLLPSFHTPMRYEFQESLRLIGKLTDVFKKQTDFVVLGIFGLGGIWSILFDEDFIPKKRKIFLAALLGLMIFYLTFVFFLPLAHRPGGTRLALYVGLPISIFAGVFARFLASRYGIYARIPLIILFSILIAIRISERYIAPPYGYTVAKKAHEDLIKENYKLGKIYICTIDKAKTASPVWKGHIKTIVLHLRFLGWQAEHIDCSEKKGFWQNRISDPKSPVLRFYRKPYVEEAYLNLLTSKCKHEQLIVERGRIYGNVCY
ncbi:MAG: hypothetical protein R3A13_04430 [Bdellovibrionota bacterium]